MSLYSHFISVVPEINDLRFVKMRTGKAYKGATVLESKKNQYSRALLVRFADGTLYTWGISPRGNSGGAYLPSRVQLPILQMCVEIGAISQANLDAHIAAYQQSWDAQEASGDLLDLEELLTKYSVKVPSKLLAVLKKKAQAKYKVAHGKTVKARK